MSSNSHSLSIFSNHNQPQVNIQESRMDDDNNFMPKQPVQTQFKNDFMEVGNFDEKNELILGTQVNMKTGVFKYIKKRKGGQNLSISNYNPSNFNMININYICDNTAGSFNANLRNSEDNNLFMDIQSGYVNDCLESCRYSIDKNNIKRIEIGKWNPKESFGFEKGAVVTFGHKLGEIMSVFNGSFVKDDKSSNAVCLEEGTKIYVNTVINGKFSNTLDNPGSYVVLKKDEITLYNTDKKVYKKTKVHIESTSSSSKQSNTKSTTLSSKVNSNDNEQVIKKQKI